MPDPDGSNENGDRLSPSKEELEEILQEHKKWLDSDGEKGKRADLSGGGSVGGRAKATLIEADLSGINLSRINPKRPNLTEADLLRIDLSGIDLSGADLRGFILSGADLSRANLREADLGGANLNGANLREADLRKADLSGANLSGANLNGAKLHNALLGGTLFFKTQLQGAKGLDTIRHFGASSLDHFTLAQSDSLPISFLRGCGLPDLIINNVDVLRGDPVQFYSCFISYSNENQDFAERLHADLQDEGVRCWFAPQELEGGRKLHEQINEAIRVHNKLVLILSEASMESNWVEHEVREARQRERKENRRVLFPVSLTSFSDLQGWTLFDADEGRDLAREVREYYIPDFSDWKDHDAYQEAFDELISGLRKADGR